MNTQKGPLFYKATREKPLRFNDGELKDVYRRLMNDPIRLSLIEAKRKLLEYSAPFFIVDKINNTMETKYDDETTKMLNQIDNEMAIYLTNVYGEYLSLTIKEEK